MRIAALGVALGVLLGSTIWQFREVRRLETLLGSEVDWLRAAGAFKLRMIQDDRADYPAEWHRGARRVNQLEVVRVVAAIAAFVLFTGMLTEALG